MSVIDQRSHILEDLTAGTVVGIFGRVGSGRTSVARSIASEYEARGFRLAIAGREGSELQDGAHVEYAPLPHFSFDVTAAAASSRDEILLQSNAGMVVYDGEFRRDWRDDVIDPFEWDREAGRVVLVVSNDLWFSKFCDINVLAGAPTRQQYAAVFNRDAPSEGVLAPKRGTAFIARAGEEPVLITYRFTSRTSDASSAG